MKPFLSPGILLHDFCQTYLRITIFLNLSFFDCSGLFPVAFFWGEKPNRLAWRFIYEELCCRSEGSFPVIFCSADTPAQIQTDGAARVDISNYQSDCQHYAKYGRYISTDQPPLPPLSCLYCSSSNCVDSVLCSLYLRSSRTPSTVRLWFILPLLWALTSSLLLVSVLSGQCPPKCVQNEA